MKQKILILGATGFIGRNTAEYFATQSDFIVYGTYFNSSPLNHPDIQMLHADLTKHENVDRVIEGMDIVVQAAAITSGIKDVASNPHKDYCRQRNNEFFGFSICFLIIQHLILFYAAAR